jgi:hypothetical protein
MYTESDLAVALFPFTQDNMAPYTQNYEQSAAADAIDDFSAADNDSVDSREASSGDFDYASHPSPSSSWSPFEDVEEEFPLPDLSLDWRFAAASSLPSAPIARAMRKTTCVEESKQASLSLMDVIPESIGCTGTLFGAEGVRAVARELFRQISERDNFSDDDEDSFGSSMIAQTAFALAHNSLPYTRSIPKSDEGLLSAPAEVLLDTDLNTAYLSVQPMRKARAKNLSISTAGVKRELPHDSADDEDAHTLASATLDTSVDGGDNSSDNSSVSTLLLQHSPDRFRAGSQLAGKMLDAGDEEGYDGMSSDDGMGENDNNWGYGSRRGHGSSASQSLASPSSIGSGSCKRQRGAKIAAARAALKVIPAPAAHGRPYTCDLCPAGFIRKHDLKRHERIHLGWCTSFFSFE